MSSIVVVVVVDVDVAVVVVGPLKISNQWMKKFVEAELHDQTNDLKMTMELKPTFHRKSKHLRTRYDATNRWQMKKDFDVEVHELEILLQVVEE